MGQAHTNNACCACQDCSSPAKNEASSMLEAHEEADQVAAKLLATSTLATRNAGCCVLDDEAFCEPITPMERIAYWSFVGVAAGVSIALVFGTLGYLSAKACGL